jgi:hypothetical protein
MEEHMVKIKQYLKNTHDRNKIYVDKGREHGEFRVGEHVFLKLKKKRSSMKS